MLSGIARHPRAVALTLVLLTAATTWVATQLQPNTELTALLPSTSSAAQAYRAVAEDFGNAEKVFVVVRSADATNPVEDTRLLEAVWRLEELLGADPQVASIRTGIEEADERFWLDAVVARGALLLPDERWETELESKLSPDSIKSRALWLRRLVSSSAAPPLVAMARSDPLGLYESRFSLQGGSLPIEPLTGSFLSAEGDAAMAIITPSARELDPDAGRALLESLQNAEDSLTSELGPLDLLAVGGPIYAAADERAIRRDVMKTVSTSAAGSALIMLLVFRSLWTPAAVLTAVLSGMSWLFATMVALDIHVSALSLAFAAVLVGLGVDYGIHLGTRLRERQLETDSDHDRAGVWRRVLQDAGPAILTSALTTAAAFAVLTRANLGLLSDLGVLVALGILLILIATGTLGGALLLSRQPNVDSAPGRTWEALGTSTRALCQLGQRSKVATLGGAALLTAVALPGVFRLGIETDLRDLRPQSSPLLVAERVVAESFGVGADTASVVIRGVDEDDALERARHATRFLRELLPPGSEVTSPSDLLIGPRTAAQRLERLATLELDAAATLLEQELRLAGLDPRAFRKGLDALRAFGAGRDLDAVAALPRPDWLAESVVRDEGGETRIVLRVRLPKDTWTRGAPDEVLEGLEKSAPGAGVATMPAVAADLEAAARSDLRWLGTLAAVVVVLVVTVAFRGSLWRASLAVLPVTLGSLWTLGIIGWFYGAIDLVGLAVLPIVLGIGIDDGLHAVFGASSLRRVVDQVRSAGRAMTVTTLTTGVGFGSLLLSELAGVRRAGLAVAVGVTLCLLATLVVLPAIASLRAPRNQDDAA